MRAIIIDDKDAVALSGPALDVAVCRAFPAAFDRGWGVGTARHRAFWNLPTYEDAVREMEAHPERYGPGYGPICDHEPSSTLDGGAMAAVEWLRPRGWELVLEDWGEAHGWCAYFNEPDGGTTRQVLGKGPAEAICRAALLVAAREGRTCESLPG